MALGLLIAIPAVALADTIVADADFVQVGNQAGTSNNPIDMGKVKAGGSVTKQVSFQLICNDAKHVDQGQTVTLSNPAPSGNPSGSTVSATNATIGPIPASWPDDGIKCTDVSPAPTPLEDNGNTTATFTAPTGAANGAVYDFSLTWNGNNTSQISVSPSGSGDSGVITNNPRVYFQVTVDAVAPDTTITSGPSGTVNSNSATFNFSSNEANSTFETRLDNGTWVANGTAPSKTYNNLSNGSHTFDVRATDPAGNVDQSPASRSWTVQTDSTAPVINSTLNPANADGSNGWYKSNVSLTWSVTDPESAVTKTGCADQNITTDQQATTYSCSATSAGGSAAQQSVTLKRDATAPTNVQFVGGPDAGGTYAFGSVPNAPTCTADDATSTVDTCVVTGYGNAVGGHTLTATATDKAGNKTTATRTYTVNKATAQVDLSNLNQTYDGSAKSVGVTTDPAGLDVNVTYNGSSTAPTNAGTYNVVATVNNANYQGSANGQLVIAKASQAISFAPLADKTFGDANFNVSATGGNSGNAVTFTADGNCSVSGNTVQIAGAGSCTITASQAGNANYNAASPVERSFAIAKAQASMNLSGLSKTYTGQPQGATVTTTPADLGGVSVTYDGSAQAPTNAGSYRVVASLTNPNYEAQNATGTLVIAKAKAGVTLSDLTQTYDGTVKAASASTTPSGLNVGFAYSQNGSPATPKNAGSYAVVATVNNANYEGSANGTLVIDKAQATINLSDLSKTYTGPAQGATVTTNPDVPNAQLTVTYDWQRAVGPTTPAATAWSLASTTPTTRRGCHGTLVIAKAEATINLAAEQDLHRSSPRRHGHHDPG
jgi:hypothetical protein